MRNRERVMVTPLNQRPNQIVRFLVLGFLLWVIGWMPDRAYAALGFGPDQYPSKQNYGEGVYFAPYETKIYTEPSEDAPLADDLVWSHNSLSLMVFSKLRNAQITARKIFVSFYPSLDVAVMAVVSDNDEGWAEVVYDQASQKTGWVKLGKPETADAAPAHFGRFQPWLEFMKYNARANGIYWLQGVSQYNRLLRSSPEDTAKTIPVIVVKDLRVKHVRGNWLLVEILDFNHSTPIGWIRWRDDEGQLMVFTNFAGDKLPMMTTSGF